MLDFHDLKLILTTTLITSTSIFIILKLNQQSSAKALKQKIKSELKFIDTPEEDEVQKQELIKEQLARNYALFGDEGQSLIRNSFVIVVGLGGVGSHAASMLVRSGVQKIRIIDFDQVSLSSLNRHASARLSDVGSSKTSVLAKYFKDICPWVIVEECNELFNIAAAERLLSNYPDFVLDCIDNIDTKLELMNFCVKRSIPIISSMGSGCKTDPSRIQISDISTTFEDPLSKSCRRGLKKYGIASGVTVVYSTEKPRSGLGLIPLDDDKVQEAKQYSALPDFRVRILPVLGTIPAMFGNAMATFVLTKLAKLETEPLRAKYCVSLFNKILNDFSITERNEFGVTTHTKLTGTDISYLILDVWQGKSAINGSLTNLAVGRWDKEKEPTFGNLVCFTRVQLAQHYKLNGMDEVANHYGKDVMDYVADRFAKDKEWNMWREEKRKIIIF